MGKVCWINGQPYLVSLPMGGKDEYDFNNPWDEIINFLGEESNDVFHWENMYSWCQEFVNESFRVVRGYNLAREWNCYRSTVAARAIGFRPVLTPLDPTTLKPDGFLMDDISDGSRFALMSLYMNGKPVVEPQNPVWNGDIMDYIPGTEITFGDRDSDPENWIYVIKHKNLLWVERNILQNITWRDLEQQGYTWKN